ncbi:MAG: KpsF/GutQ family sugar-phosphate isomerase [Kiritimatiellae bacterium]|nr:KpsF/GutQ family sugar-phosphate isomerase [Kiritimatiellia bacterium]
MTANDQITRAKEVFDIEIEGLRRVRDSLGESFTRTIALMQDALAHGGKVVVSGVGKNLHVAEKMSAIFASTGVNSIVLNPVQAMHGDLGMTGANDVLLALSFSGESEEVVRLIPAVRRHGLKVVALVGNPASTLAKLADVVLEIPCGKEACPFGMAPTNSTTATMAMGDALAMVMIDVQAFDRERYALNHPAGAIGRALVLKVSDIMRTGERCAKVAPETTVLDTLLAMTKAQGGSAVVVNPDGTLAGIFTDGDFRRRIAEAARAGRAPYQVENAVESPDGQTAFGLSTPVSAVMTAKPLFIRDDAYAADLLKVFERRHIDDLPVCDAAGRVLGLVDIQDLPKMKVL